MYKFTRISLKSEMALGSRILECCSWPTSTHLARLGFGGTLFLFGLSNLILAPLPFLDFEPSNLRVRSFVSNKSLEVCIFEETFLFDVVAMDSSRTRVSLSGVRMVFNGIQCIYTHLFLDNGDFFVRHIHEV